MKLRKGTYTQSIANNALLGALSHKRTIKPYEAMQCRENKRKKVLSIKKQNYEKKSIITI